MTDRIAGCANRHAARARCLIAALALYAHTGLTEELRGTQRIFRCEANDKVIFSDRPCAALPGASTSGVTASTEVVLSPINSYRADRPGATRATAKSAVGSGHPIKQSESIAVEQLRERQRCQRLADQLTNIEIKMRSGYSAKQGEQLRERQRQLEQRRRTERCR